MFITAYHPIASSLVIRTTLITALATFHIGCTSWPSSARGGFAEHDHDAFIPIEAHQHITYKHGLRLDYDISHNQLNYLATQGATHCFPAAVTQARLLDNRIIREIQSELYADAANNLIVQRTKLAQLERNVNVVWSQGACNKRVTFGDAVTIEPSRTIKSETIPNLNADNNRYLHDLLNSDNQFAIASFDINPKYLARLHQASKLLTHKSNLDLIIRGHADTLGASQENQQLSYKRAERVADVLIKLGFPKSQIHIHAESDQSPLFVGSEDYIRLVNRRVNVDIVNSTRGETK